jgi:tetratricopeptide (TPR) repeat protein
VKAKQAAIPFLQEMLKKHPQSPRAEWALRQLGMLQCQAAEVATGDKSQRLFQEAAGTLSKFAETYPQTAYADVYVSLIDLQLERLFDIQAAAAVAEIARKSVETSESGVSAPNSAADMPAWAQVVSSQLPDARHVSHAIHLRRGLIAYLKGEHSQAEEAFALAKRTSDPDRTPVAFGEVTSGMDALIQVAQDGLALTPSDVTTQANKSALALQLADIYSIAQRYDHALRLADIVIQSQTGDCTKAQLSWAYYRRGRSWYCLDWDTRDSKQALQDYLNAHQVLKNAPWAYQCLFLAGNIQYNHMKDLAGAIELWKRVCKEYPQSPESHRCAYYIAVAYADKGDREEALRAFQQFLKDYPDSPFVRLVKTHHLTELARAPEDAKTNK